jgi:8-oxo-dGTP pyrophosphatase MutT (NUDIX family)
MARIADRWVKRRTTIIAAVGGVVYRSDERGRLVMLLIRKREGYWTLPKGKLCAGESHAEALVREVAEETGVVGVVEREIGTLRYLTPRRRPPLPKEVTYYLVRAVTCELRLSRDEAIIGARWVSLRAAARTIHRKRVRRVVRTAAAMLATDQAPAVL